MAAKRPSKRRHKVESEVELKLVPVMSLMVVLVPMLLSTAVFEQIASIQMNLPSADEVKYLEETDPEDLQDGLTLAITDEGFLLASGEAKLAKLGLAANGGFNFAALDKALQKAKKSYPKQEALILLIEDAIIYDDIIHTMDRCRPFFPAVSLADRVQAPPEE